MHKTILFGILSLFLSASRGQVAPVLPATTNMGGGSSALTPNFIIDWSIGESSVIETFYGENFSTIPAIGFHWNVTSGILQPYDKNFIIYNYIFPTWTSQEIHIYPVPTPGMVYLDFRSVTSGRISIQLYSQDQKLLGIKEFTQVNGSSTQSWNLSNQRSGMYYFRILLTSDRGIILKQGTFKVEKNK